MTHISADIQRLTLNIMCMMISGGRTKQLDIFCRVTGFMSDFHNFIVVELIRFFHGALQLYSSAHGLGPAELCSGLMLLARASMTQVFGVLIQNAHMVRCSLNKFVYNVVFLNATVHHSRCPCLISL